jgi:hypothetical protein
MSLTQIFTKIKAKNSSIRPTNGVETITFTEAGEVERRFNFKPYFLSLVIILVSLGSYGLGKLSPRASSEPIKIEYDENLVSSYSAPLKNQTASAIKSLPSSTDHTVYASSKGKKYYYANCSGLKKVSEANKISFPDSSAAEVAGYTLAANCTAR